MTATVTTREGERIHGRLTFIDDFEIKLALEDGIDPRLQPETAVSRTWISSIRSKRTSRCSRR